MKKILNILLLFLFAQSLLATDYYFRDDGNDGNTGTSHAQAWQSMHKLNTLMASLSPGDRVFFERGSTWDSVSVYIPAATSGSYGNPIEFSAYGTGANPIFYGTKSISSGSFTENSDFWTVTDTDLPDTKENYPDIVESVTYTYFLGYIFVDGVAFTCGRYPNTGYLTAEDVDNTAGYSYLQDTDASWSNDEWIGAHVGVEHVDWIFTKSLISDNTSNTLTLTPGDFCTSCAGGAYLSDGLQYIFLNDSLCLDQNGEFFLDYDNQRLVVYHTGSFTAVRVPVVDSIWAVYGNYIELNSLDFIGSRVNGLKMYNSDGSSVDSCAASYCGFAGFHAISCDTLDFTNNESYYCSLGVYAHSNSEWYVSDGYHYYNGLDLTTYDRDNTFGNGFFAVSRDGYYEIKRTLVDSSGYCSFHIKEFTGGQGFDLLVENNLSLYPLIYKSDGAHYYIVSDDEDVDKIIRGNVGWKIAADDNNFGTSWLKMGIYPDNNTRYMLIDSNTIYDTPNGAYVNYGGHYNTFRENTFVKFNKENPTSTNRGGIWIHNVGDATNNLTFKKNNLVATDYGGSVGFITNNTPGDYSINGSVIDSNVYYNQYGSQYDPIRFKENWNSGTLYDLSDWYSLSGYEQHSTMNAANWDYTQVSGIAEDDFVRVYTNWSNSTHQFDLGSAIFRNLAGTQISGNIQVPAYESRVLLYAAGNLATADEPLYYVGYTPTYPQNWLTGNYSLLIDAALYHLEIDTDTFYYGYAEAAAEENNLLDDLISYYSFDSDATDDHGSNNGSVNGATHTDPGGWVGGYCYSFDGNDLIDLGAIALLGDTGTVTACFKFNTSSGNANRCMMSRDYNQDGISLSGSSYHQIGVNGSYINDGTAQDTDWHQIVLVYDGTNKTLYVDGTQENQNSESGNWANDADDWEVGANGNGSSFMIGYIDNVGLWDRPLSSDDVTTLWNSGSPIDYDDFD